jgi:hypothetical protein
MGAITGDDGNALIAAQTDPGGQLYMVVLHAPLARQTEALFGSTNEPDAGLEPGTPGGWLLGGRLTLIGGGSAVSP